MEELQRKKNIIVCLILFCMHGKSYSEPQGLAPNNAPSFRRYDMFQNINAPMYEDDGLTLEQRCSMICPIPKCPQNENESQKNPITTPSSLETTQNIQETTIYSIPIETTPSPTNEEIINETPRDSKSSPKIESLNDEIMTTNLPIQENVNELTTQKNIDEATTQKNNEEATTVSKIAEISTNAPSNDNEDMVKNDEKIEEVIEGTTEKIMIEPTTTVKNIEKDEKAEENKIDIRQNDSNLRKSKGIEEPDANGITETLAPLPSTDALIKLIQELTKKIENLEKTQKVLHENIDELHRKLESSPAFLEKKEETTNEIILGDPLAASAKYKNLTSDIRDTDQLKNVTNNIVEEALEAEAPPESVLDFVNEIPNKDAKEAAYGTVADKMNSSEKIQEQMYWRDMTPYCNNAARDIGNNNPSTIKMISLQNQMRLNAAKPIAQSCRSIQQEQYMPAIINWVTMTRDIPDSPPQLENNMKKMMLKTYEGNEAYLPFAFQFILYLPQTQGYFKQVAYKCLTQEMRANGHFYNPNSQQRATRNVNVGQNYGENTYYAQQRREFEPDNYYRY